MVVYYEHVVGAFFGVFEQFADGGDLFFGVSEVEVLGAVLSADDERSVGFDPAAFVHAAADLDLVFEGGAFGLFFGGDG